MEATRKRTALYIILLLAIVVALLGYRSLTEKEAHIERAEVFDALETLHRAQSKHREKTKKYTVQHEDLVKFEPALKKIAKDKRFVSYPGWPHFGLAVVSMPTSTLPELIWIDQLGFLHLIKIPVKIKEARPKEFLGLTMPIEMSGTGMFSEGGSIVVYLSGKNKKDLAIWLPRPSHPRRVLMFDHVETPGARELTLSQEKALWIVFQYLLKDAQEARDWENLTVKNSDLDRVLAHLQEKFEGTD